MFLYTRLCEALIKFEYARLRFHLFPQELPEGIRSLQTYALPERDRQEIPALDELTAEYLANHRYLTLEAIHEHICMDVHFDKVVHSYVEYDDMAQAEGHNPDGVIQWSGKSSEGSFLWRRFEYIWLLKVRPWLFGALFVGACLWSAFTAFAEISTITGRDPNLSVLSLILDRMSVNDSAPGTVFFVLFLMMGYQALATFFTFFKIRLGNWYHLPSLQQSQPVMLIWNACMLARFAPSLVRTLGSRGGMHTFCHCHLFFCNGRGAFFACVIVTVQVQNFLKLLREETNTDPTRAVLPSFTAFFGTIDLIPFLGPGVDVILPLLLGILIVLTWKGQLIYTRWLKDYNFVLLDWIEETIETEERAQSGKDLLVRATRRLRDATGSGMYKVSSATSLTSSSDRVELEEGLGSGSSSAVKGVGASKSSKSSTAVDPAVDIQAYLKSVRDRHNSQKNRYQRLDD